MPLQKPKNQFYIQDFMNDLSKLYQIAQQADDYNNASVNLAWMMLHNVPKYTNHCEIPQNFDKKRLYFLSDYDTICDATDRFLTISFHARHDNKVTISTAIETKDLQQATSGFNNAQKACLSFPISDEIDLVHILNIVQISESIDLPLINKLSTMPKLTQELIMSQTPNDIPLILSLAPTSQSRKSFIATSDAVKTLYHNLALINHFEPHQ